MIERRKMTMDETLDFLFKLFFITLMVVLYVSLIVIIIGCIFSAICEAREGNKKEKKEKSQTVCSEQSESKNESTFWLIRKYGDLYLTDQEPESFKYLGGYLIPEKHNKLEKSWFKEVGDDEIARLTIKLEK